MDGWQVLLFVAMNFDLRKAVKWMRQADMQEVWLLW
jgi:hypothetical protein